MTERDFQKIMEGVRPDPGEMAGKALQLMESLLSEEGEMPLQRKSWGARHVAKPGVNPNASDGRCPTGQHKYHGKCVDIETIKQYAASSSQAAHAQHTPAAHKRAAVDSHHAYRALRAAGHHADAKAHLDAAKDHAFRYKKMTGGFSVERTPCPQGQYRTRSGHCASANDLSTRAHNASKIADLRTDQANLHGTPEDHRQAKMAHLDARDDHNHVVKTLSPAAQTNSGLAALVQKHSKAGQEHQTQYQAHHAAHVKSAVGDRPEPVKPRPAPPPAAVPGAVDTSTTPKRAPPRPPKAKPTNYQ
jgi:hypothetical protein